MKTGKFKPSIFGCFKPWELKIQYPLQAIEEIEMAATFYQERQLRIFVRHDEFSEAKLRIVVSYMFFVVVLSEPIGTKLHPSKKTT